MPAQLSIGAKSVNLGLSLYLHPYFMLASGEGASEAAHLVSLTRALAAPICNEYQKLI